MDAKSLIRERNYNIKRCLLYGKGIYFIITTCINNKHGVKDYNHRKDRYINSITKLLEFIKDTDINPIIVENNGKRKTYLDGLNCDVVYTENNSIDTPYKGIKQYLDIKDVIKQYNIDDDDTIMVITGRYRLMSKSFIDLVVKNHKSYDCFLKFFNVCTLEYMTNDCAPGVYAIKSKYLKKFIFKGLRSFEVELATYVRENISKEKLYEVKNLDLEYCPADDLRLIYV